MSLESLNGNKSGWGGARPGAGRKPIDQELRKKDQREMRAIFNQMVDAEWEEIVGCLIKAARRNPETARYLIDQRVGRATQVTELSGEVTLAQPILGGTSVLGDDGDKEDQATPQAD